MDAAPDLNGPWNELNDDVQGAEGDETSYTETVVDSVDLTLDTEVRFYRARIGPLVEP